MQDIAPTGTALQDAISKLGGSDLTAEFAASLAGTRFEHVIWVRFLGTTSIASLLKANSELSQTLGNCPTIAILDFFHYQDSYSLIQNLDHLIEYMRAAGKYPRKRIVMINSMNSQTKMLIQKIAASAHLATQFVFGTNEKQLLDQAKRKVHEMLAEEAATVK